MAIFPNGKKLYHFFLRLNDSILDRFARAPIPILGPVAEVALAAALLLLESARHFLGRAPFLFRGYGKYPNISVLLPTFSCHYR